MKEKQNFILSMQIYAKKEKGKFARGFVESNL